MIPAEESFTERLMVLMQKAEWGAKRGRCDFLLLNEADLRLLCEEDNQERQRRWLKRERRFHTVVGVDYDARPVLVDPERVLAGTSAMTFNDVPVLVARVDKPTFAQGLVP